MTATKAFYCVVGLIFLIFIEGVIKNFLPGFPFGEAIAGELSAAGFILGTKIWNDTSEMKYGIRAKATTTTTFSAGEVKTESAEGGCK